MKNSIARVFLCILAVMIFVNVNVQASTLNVQTLNVDGEKVTVSVLSDTKDSKVVQSEDSKAITLTTYDKKNNTINVKQTDKLTKKVTLTDKKVDENKIKSSANKLNQLKSNSISAASTYLVNSEFSILWDDAYLYYSDKRWAIWNSSNSYYSTYETSSNSSDLLGFKNSVDSQVGYELAAIASVGTAACATVVGVLTAPTGVGAIVGVLVAIGAAISAGVTLWNAYKQRDNADFYWSRV
ncbi:geobacillin-26 family protein [Clostridium sp. YIM B02505]|uniref:Geobacillin-26 family protein n=1 Tax=Clostridium yunnanense TaxID=2800325 RepID=A0ABS1EJG6_9CLOT|nr:geobacillin-26 family protein [Clostridium yunnanense]MBK1809485.1 geobacillin-26 family protein [Clostridium yunnanense]